MKKKLLSLLLAASMGLGLMGCAEKTGDSVTDTEESTGEGATASEASTEGSDAETTETVVGINPEWAETTTFYEVFVRSFADGNGDGIGDFKGLEENLDYLKDLGIGAIWLMPMMDSTTYHGYDVKDYYTTLQSYYIAP